MVKELNQRYLSARLKASVEANRTLLEYYWSLGRDIAGKQYANTYESGFYKTLSHDLRSEMPEEKGFSESNIRYIYRFYQLYSQLFENLPQGVENFASSNLPQGVDDFKMANFPQLAENLFVEKSKALCLLSKRLNQLRNNCRKMTRTNLLLFTSPYM